MKSPTVLLVVLAGVFLMAATPTQAQHPEEEAVRAAVGLRQAAGPGSSGH